MFNETKSLIVVYKDEMLLNELRKLVETKDDTAEGVVGVKDGSVKIVSWNEKMWLGQKKNGTINNKVLFIGDIKNTDQLIPILDVKFDKYGVMYGWAGNQAVLTCDPKKLGSDEYQEFLKDIENLDIPEAIKKAKAEPIGDRCFKWEGHYTKYCYELSGENFHDSGDFNWKCREKYIPITFYDPSSSDKEFNQLPTDKELVSLREMEELCDVTFDEVLERLMDFCDGEIGDGDHCYDFDEFGFDVDPTKEQFTEWLEQLRFVKDEVETNLDASAFFEEDGF